MVELVDIITHFTSNWDILQIQLPTMKDKNIAYFTLYPHFLFINIHEPAGTNPVTQSGGLDSRITNFFIYGIYDSKANANLALIQIKLLMLSKTIAGGEWHMAGKVKFITGGNNKRIIFIAPCRERILLLTANW